MRALMLISGFLLALLPVSAVAAPLRYTVDLTLEELNRALYVGFGFPESATIVFDLDFSSDVEFSADPRLSLVSSDLPLGSDLGFLYSITDDWFIVGGVEIGIPVMGGTNDFFVSIISFTDPLSRRYFFEVAAAREGVGSIASYTGTIRSSPVIAAIPLPASGALLAGALAGLGLLRRRWRPTRPATT